MVTNRDRRRLRTVGVAVMAALAIPSTLCLANPCPPARAEEPMSTRPGNRVPFQLVENLVYLPVRLDGHELHFLLDTGASASVVDAAKAKEIGLIDSGPAIRGQGGGEKGVAAVPVRLRELVVGDETLRDWTVYAIPLPGTSEALGEVVDGVLGYDFMRRHSVEIDYVAKVVTFHDDEGFRDYKGPGESIPFTLENNHIQVSAELLRAGKEPLAGKFTVDLGMTSALILNAPFVKANRLLDEVKAGAVGPIGMGVGGEMKGAFGRVGGLRLGPFTLDEPDVAFSLATGGYFASPDRAGNIGAEVLRRFRVVFDYPRDRMILEKAGSFAEPFEHDMSGLRLVADGPGLRTVKVHGVSEDSPAAEAGVRAGDVVVTIDGRPASERSLADWRRSLRHAGETRHLVLKRGDAEVKADLALRRRF